MTSPSSRRRFIALLAGISSAFIVGDRALAAKKPPVKKVTKKKVVKKAPVKQPVAKPTAQPSPTPSSSPSVQPSQSPSSTPSPSPSPTATIASPPSDAKELIVAGRPLTTANLAIGATTAATFPKNGLTTSVLVTRIDEKNFVALKPICTHAGGPVELSGGSLLCSWHFSRFNQKTGEVINGPATTSLTAEKVALFGDTLFYIP